jgi:sugar lactone lactonase YvrE
VAPQAHALQGCADRPEVRVISSGHGSLESVGVDRRGRLFFTDGSAGQLLMISRRGDEPRVIADGIDGPGGIIFQRRSGRVLVGFGNSFNQAIDGVLNPEGGLLRVDPRTGETQVHTTGLQAANGVARGPGQDIYASNAASSGVDRVAGDQVELAWAPLFSPNGLIADRSKRFLLANQLLGPAMIMRVPFDNPGAARPYWTAPLTDAAAGLDGLARDVEGRLYAAAFLAGDVWRVDGQDSACSLMGAGAAPTPSDVAFGRKGGGFGPRNLYVTTYGGELLELVGVR